MKAVMFVDDEEDIRELGALELEGKLDVTVIEVNSGEEAIEYLKKNGDVEIVISDYDMPKGNGDVIYNYIKKYNDEEIAKKAAKDDEKNIAFVLFTSRDLVEFKSTANNPFNEFPKDQNKSAYLQKPEGFKDLAQTVKQLLTKNTQEPSPATDNIGTTPECTSASCTTSEFTLPEYCKVNIKRFSKFNTSNCDVYLRLSKDKHLKIINRNELYDSIQIEKYASKGVNFFYVKSDDFTNFSNYYAQTLTAKLSSEKFNQEERLDLEIESMHFVQEVIHGLGINQTVVNTVNALMDSNQKIIKNDQNLLDLLKKMKKNKNYIYEHSLLISYFGCLIATEMKWSTQATLQKISAAAIMHDMLLEDPELAKIDSLDETTIKEKKLTPPQIDLIKKHPAEIAEKVRKIKSLPPDIDQMILDHHEKPEGGGFPRGIPSIRIAPLTSILIMTEDFVNQIYDKEINRETVQKTAAKIKSKYTHGNFRKTLDGMLKVLSQIK
ncbi:MAG: response regulator [Oligoflexia bacterium]|nr:response regulator [Oligoflexia bacterium]